MGEITIKKLEIGTAAYWAAFNLRNEILRKPRGQNLYHDDLSYEALSSHTAALEGDKVIGASCWYEDGGNGLVKHLVVEDAARGKGVGTLLLRYAEEEMVSRGISKCVLKARVSVTGFYEKLGYHTVGDIMPDDVPHIMMEKFLSED